MRRRTAPATPLPNRRASSVVALALLLPLGCSDPPPRKIAPRPTGQQLTVQNYILRQESGETELCEMIGEVRNSGRVVLPSPNLIAQFRQGEVHKGVAQQDISGAIAPGETVRFGMPYFCAKGGNRISFTATVHGEEIEVRYPPGAAAAPQRQGSDAAPAAAGNSAEGG